MSSDVLAIQNAEAASRPWVETLHEWVTTVDSSAVLKQPLSASS